MQNQVEIVCDCNPNFGLIYRDTKIVSMCAKE